MNVTFPTFCTVRSDVGLGGVCFQTDGTEIGYDFLVGVNDGFGWATYRNVVAVPYDKGGPDCGVGDVIDGECKQ